MTVYVVVDIEVTDPAGYEDYKKLAPVAVEKYGGKYLARGGHSETLEGDWNPSRAEYFYHAILGLIIPFFKEK